MSDIPAGWAMLAGAGIGFFGSLVGLLGSWLAGRWSYLATTSGTIRKERISKIETELAELLAGLNILAFSCRHQHKAVEDDLALYEKARTHQCLLLILLDPEIVATNALIDAMEGAFGLLKPGAPPSPADIAGFAAKIVAHGKNVVTAELDLLRRGK